MADIIRDIFKCKKADPEKLTAFGFQRQGDVYAYDKILAECGFVLEIRVSTAGGVSARVFDPSFGEEYSLHLTDTATGEFVGNVRKQYTETLAEIGAKCFMPDVFQCAQTKKLIAYVKDVYGDNVEFLWEKLPKAAIWRRPDTKKWYGTLLTVSKSKLGLSSNETVEIVDLRMPPDELKNLIDGKTYFAGYHMNKKHWLSIILDGSVDFEEICGRVEVSRSLAKTKK